MAITPALTTGGNRRPKALAGLLNDMPREPSNAAKAIDPVAPATTLDNTTTALRLVNRAKNEYAIAATRA